MRTYIYNNVAWSAIYISCKNNSAQQPQTRGITIAIITKLKQGADGMYNNKGISATWWTVTGEAQADFCHQLQYI